MKINIDVEVSQILKRIKVEIDENNWNNLTESEKDEFIKFKIRNSEQPYWKLHSYNLRKDEKTDI